MKKDIAWLKAEVEKQDIVMDKGYIYTSDLLYLIDKLGEPKVLSHEGSISIVLNDLKEYIKEQQSLSQIVGLSHISTGNDTHYKQYDYVLECINEYEPSDELQNLLAPKQELPVIPKYVADWIKDLKSKNINMLESIYDFKHGEDINNYMREQGDVLMRAWLDGFTIAIEEEPLYYALVKGHELMGNNLKYWAMGIYQCGLSVLERYVDQDLYSNKKTKSEWNELGIDDGNADFKAVQEWKPHK